jgi:hypothetical protein
MYQKETREETHMERRTFLTAAAAAAATAATSAFAIPPALADVLPLGDLPNTRYPDPRVEALDKRFRYKIGNAAIERIVTGFRWIALVCADGTDTRHHRHPRAPRRFGIGDRG